jgi:hypothetical protein
MITYIYAADDDHDHDDVDDDNDDDNNDNADDVSDDSDDDDNDDSDDDDADAAGTEKYPVENHYKQFLSKHGGSSNASTSMETTVYKFDVNYKHFEEALDIFRSEGIILPS